jgi:hypothetical protein
MSDDTRKVEVTSRGLRLKGECPETGDEITARKGECVVIPKKKADTLEAQGKVCEPGADEGLKAAQAALEADDFQGMRRACSELGIDVGPNPDKGTLRQALEAHLS